MSILATDLKFFFSGGGANDDPNASLGGAKSSVAITDNTLNNLFDDVSGTEHTAGDIEYRCLFVKNDSAETAYDVRVYISSNTPAADDSIKVGKDLTGVGDTADTVANENTAPDPAVTFSLATSYADGLLLGDMTTGQSYPIWIERTVVVGTTAQANNAATIQAAVDTL